MFENCNSFPNMKIIKNDCEMINMHTHLTKGLLMRPQVEQDDDPQFGRELQHDHNPTNKQTNKHLVTTFFCLFFNLGFLFSIEISIPMKSSIDQKTCVFTMLNFFSLSYAFLALLFSHYSFCVRCAFVFFLDCVLF